MNPAGTVRSGSKSVGKDLTQGPVAKVLITFAMPIILTSIIQQLYSMVDLMIIGQFVGNTGTVGVSTGGELADFMNPIAMSLSTAGQIYIAQLVGARKDQQAKRTIGTLLTLSLAFSIAAAAAAFLFCDSFLHLMNCPQEAMGQARAYLRITALGYPFIFGYNAVCGILRGMGESKRPLIFIIIAATVNIFADLLLVVVFPLEAAGTAIATILSQLGSFIAAFYFLYRRRESFDFELSRTYFSVDPGAAKVLIRLAIPQLARIMLVRISMMYVNASCNSYGLVFSAANSVGNKLQKFLEVFIQGIDSGSATVIGQNLGAGKQDRAAKTVWSTLWIALLISAGISLISLLFPTRLYGLFTKDTAVWELGIIFLRIMCLHYFCSAFVGAFQSMVTGCGFVELGFAIGILDGVICKIGFSLLFVRLGVGQTSYWWGTAVSRFLPGCLCMWYFLSGKWKTRTLLGEKNR